MRNYRAGHRIRTGDIQLGKLASILRMLGITVVRREERVPRQPGLGGHWTSLGETKGGCPPAPIPDDDVMAPYRRYGCP